MSLESEKDVLSSIEQKTKYKYFFEFSKQNVLPILDRVLRGHRKELRKKLADYETSMCLDKESVVLSSIGQKTLHKYFFKN